MAILVCGDCVGGYVEVHKSCTPGACHVDSETDTDSFQDAYGVWWRPCGECKGTGVFEADLDLAVALLGGML